MLRLLQLEWLKLKPNATFRVFVLLYLLALPLFFPIGLFMDFPKEFSILSIYSFPDVWSFAGYLGSWLTFFCFGFLGVLMITNEYAFKTLRQNIMTGLTRSEFLASKLIMFGAISLFATIYYCIVVLGYGYSNTDFIINSKVLEQTYLIPSYFLQCFGYMCVGFFIGFLVKRSGLAVFLLLFYTFFIENIFRQVIHFNIAPGPLVNYYPMNSLEDLVPLPLRQLKFAQNQAWQRDNVEFLLTQTEAILVSSCWIGIIIGMIYLILKRRDL